MASISPQPQNSGDSGNAAQQGEPRTAGGFIGPNRIVEEIERYHLPSGRFRILRSLRYTVPEGETFRTRSEIEAVPGLDCGCQPRNMSDLTECVACQAIVCVSRHSFLCEKCGLTHCTACGVADEYGYFRICKSCWREISTPSFIRFLKRLFWGE